METKTNTDNDIAKKRAISLEKARLALRDKREREKANLAKITLSKKTEEPKNEPMQIENKEEIAQKKEPIKDDELQTTIIPADQSSIVQQKIQDSNLKRKYAMIENNSEEDDDDDDDDDVDRERWARMMQEYKKKAKTPNINDDEGALSKLGDHAKKIYGNIHHLRPVADHLYNFVLWSGGLFGLVFFRNYITTKANDYSRRYIEEADSKRTDLLSNPNTVFTDSSSMQSNNHVPYTQNRNPYLK
jgi:hypothetical protein